MPTKPNRRKGQNLVQRLGDPKPYKVHAISPLGKVRSLPEARFATLESVMRYVRPMPRAATQPRRLAAS